MTKTINIGLGLVLALAACKKDKEAGGGDKASDKGVDKSGAGGSVDASKANAAIPAAWKGKIEFTSQVLDLGKFGKPQVIAAPKGWKKGFMEGSLEPTKDFGFGTSFRAVGDCGGECKTRSAAEWETAATSEYFANAGKDMKIVKDEKGAGRRVMIVQGTYNGIAMSKITFVTWKDGADRLSGCLVDLPDEQKDLVPAFELACSTVVEAQ